MFLSLSRARIYFGLFVIQKSRQDKKRFSSSSNYLTIDNGQMSYIVEEKETAGHIP